MTHRKRKQMIANIVIFTISVVLAWGGLIYATNDPEQFRIIGVLVSFVGYGIFFWAVVRYEKDAEKQA
ncbi:MAG: hypothetical protein IJO31_04840 [Oscillospiraceae bacterium]|nr:hypothetical protein [Oscillospiraceae bacterium]